MNTSTTKTPTPEPIAGAGPNCAESPGSVIGRSKNITIHEYEKRGCRWRRDVADLAGWWCIRINHVACIFWDCGDGLWVEPNGQTMLYPSREAAELKAAPYAGSAAVIPATEAFSQNT